MKIWIFITACFFTFNGIAQKDKISIDGDLVFLNAIPVFQLDYSMKTNAIKLKDLAGNELAFFQCLYYNDSKEINSANPKGRVAYFDVTFFNAGNQKCEIPCVGMKKSIAKTIVDHHLIKDQQLDQTAVERFIAIYGTKFTENKNRSTTLIIVQ